MERKAMIDKKIGSKTTGWLALAMILLAACALGLAACSASTETKQGALGEFCNNRDTDCREGLICSNSVCILADPTVSDACRQSCNKISACGLDDLNCLNECAETLETWSDSVIDQFASCVVNDLSCSQLGDSDNDAAQICYDRLPLDEERLNRCREFKASALACNPDEDTAEFETRCLRMARTVDDARWAEHTDACAGLDACSPKIDCLNDVFQLTGDDALSVSEPSNPEPTNNAPLSLESSRG
jgi:hypothetical protein